MRSCFDFISVEFRKDSKSALKKFFSTWCRQQNYFMPSHIRSGEFWNFDHFAFSTAHKNDNRRIKVDLTNVSNFASMRTCRLYHKGLMIKSTNLKVTRVWSNQLLLIIQKVNWSNLLPPSTDQEVPLNKYRAKESNLGAA